MGRRESKRDGFTLMEVALAVVVVGVGVLAVFALISSGLDSSARAVAETQSAIFADDVFNGLRSASLSAAEGEPGEWEAWWVDFKDGAEFIKVAAAQMWDDSSGSENIQVMAGGHTNVFENLPFHSAGVDKIVNHALHYSMDVELNTVEVSPVDGAWTETVTNRVLVALKVWEGQFGSGTDAQALLFYSEFNNPAGL